MQIPGPETLPQRVWEGPGDVGFSAAPEAEVREIRVRRPPCKSGREAKSVGDTALGTPSVQSQLRLEV